MSPLKLASLVAAVALGSLAASAAAQADQPIVIPVALSEFKFSPSEIVLQKGQHYVLRLTNTGRHNHDQGQSLLQDGDPRSGFGERG
jgi:uncharacterized cupredoxin-like copper-binding protein